MIHEHTEIESSPGLTGQTPYLAGCLFSFQLYPFIVEEGNIFSNDLMGLLESWVLDLAKGFFFEISKKSFPWGCGPTVVVSAISLPYPVELIYFAPDFSIQ